jgi:hypothetical protein
MLKSKTILFLAFTRSHYVMAVELVKQLKNLEYKIEFNIFCSGYLYAEKEDLLDKNEFDKYYFFNEFPLYKNKLVSYKLRKLIGNVDRAASQVKPDIILSFSDNPPLYQDILSKFRDSVEVKVILFHEGYGDYSEVYIPLKSYIGFLIQKISIYPHRFKIITRSYTNHYAYSFLFLPDFVERGHNFKKMSIPKEFAQKVFIKPITNDEIKRDSIFLCLSAKNWTEGKLKKYFLSLLKSLNNLENSTYIKIAPHQDKNRYLELISKYTNIYFIDDGVHTSESYCFHNNFKYIVTDESSSVINALFSGLKKTIFFLNKEIEGLGYYRYDKSILMKFLIEERIIFQTSTTGMVISIQSKEESNIGLNNIKEISIGKQFEEIMNE